MWQSQTMQGLDGALTDLQKAIDALPDGSVKKGLLKRYSKLQGVRHELDNPHTRWHWELWAALACLISAFIGFLFWKLSKGSESLP